MPAGCQLCFSMASPGSAIGPLTNGPLRAAASISSTGDRRQISHTRGSSLHQSCIASISMVGPQGARPGADAGSAQGPPASSSTPHSQLQLWLQDQILKLPVFGAIAKPLAASELGKREKERKAEARNCRRPLRLSPEDSVLWDLFQVRRLSDCGEMPVGVRSANAGAVSKHPAPAPRVP